MYERRRFCGNHYVLQARWHLCTQKQPETYVVYERCRICGSHYSLQVWWYLAVAGRCPPATSKHECRHRRRISRRTWLWLGGAGLVGQHALLPHGSQGCLVLGSLLGLIQGPLLFLRLQAYHTLATDAAELKPGKEQLLT